MLLQGYLSFSCSDIKKAFPSQSVRSCWKGVKLLLGSLQLTEKITALLLKLQQEFRISYNCRNYFNFSKCPSPLQTVFLQHSLFKLHGGCSFITVLWFWATVHDELWHEGIIYLQKKMLERKERDFTLCSFIIHVISFICCKPLYIYLLLGTLVDLKLFPTFLHPLSAEMTNVWGL